MANAHIDEPVGCGLGCSILILSIAFALVLVRCTSSTNCTGICGPKGVQTSTPLICMCAP